MHCTEAEKYIYELLDHRLGGQGHRDLSSHLQGCEDCQMKLEDLIRLRAALEFSRAMDPAPAPDRNFAASVLSRVEDGKMFRLHPVLAVFMERFKSLFMPLGVRWLAPAFALLLLFMLPLFATRDSHQGETHLTPSMTMKVAQKKDLPSTPDKREKTNLDEYLQSHAHYASESDIAYPVIYASY